MGEALKLIKQQHTAIEKRIEKHKQKILAAKKAVAQAKAKTKAKTKAKVSEKPKAKAALQKPTEKAKPAKPAPKAATKVKPAKPKNELTLGSEGTAFMEGLVEAQEGVIQGQKQKKGVLARLADGYDALDACAKACYNKGLGRSLCVRRCTKSKIEPRVTAGHVLAEASQALIETSVSENKRSVASSPPAGTGNDKLSACANQCFYASKANRPACMSDCMQAMSTPIIGDKESLGESNDSTRDAQINTIAKHCRYNASRRAMKAAAMKQKREASAFSKSLDALSSQSLLQTNEGERRHMLSVQKYNKHGHRNKQAYDNTSMLCACVNGCKTSNHKCIKNCVWERQEQSRMAHATRTSTSDLA